MKRFFITLLVLFSLWLIREGCESEPPEDQGVEHLLDRPWLSKMPDGPKDNLHVLFLQRGGDGATLHGSAFRYLLVHVGHQLKKKKLTLLIRQNERKITLGAKTFPCRGPGELDLCLDLGRGPLKVRLYSSSEWSFEGDSTPPWSFLLEQGEQRGGGASDEVAGPTLEDLLR